MSHFSNLALDPAERLQLWQRLATEIERYLRQVPAARVAPDLDAGALRRELARFDFNTPLAASEALEIAVEGLWRHQVHVAHPRYFGLFNPASTTMGIVADALVAAFNPQIAAWSHSPYAAEVERHLIGAVASRFGYRAPDLDGVFCAGGAEANHTAVLCALTHMFPAYGAGGARALAAAPAIYVSALSHDSIRKAARLCGLGTDAVRALPPDASLRLRAATVREAIARDRAAGLRPMMLVATAGATATGVLDPIAELAELAAAEGLWLHTDAAWGGMAALVEELRPALDGVERSDSITFDAHKSLCVPMGAGMFFTRHPNVLEHTFRVSADYMPRDAANVEDIVDPFAHSMQWSRRFTGLKLFLSLAVAGWDGYAEVLRHQVAMGAWLRERAAASGWRVVNETPLPLACLVDAGGADAATVARAAVASGEAWVSSVHLPGGVTAIRACITSYRTQAADVEALVALLDRCREAVASC